MSKQNYRCAGCGSKVEMGTYKNVYYYFIMLLPVPDHLVCLQVCDTQYLCLD